MSEQQRQLGHGILHKRVVQDAMSHNLAPERVMRWVAGAAFFEFLNVAVTQGRLEAYLVKGGFAVELRYPTWARTSKDIDIVLSGTANAAALLNALLPGDWEAFHFVARARNSWSTPLLLPCKCDSMGAIGVR